MKIKSWGIFTLGVAIGIGTSSTAVVVLKDKYVILGKNEARNNIETLSAITKNSVSSSKAEQTPSSKASETVQTISKERHTVGELNGSKQPSKESIDENLRVYIENPFPQGRVTSRNTKEDGTINTHEEFEDGSTIDRIFFQNGIRKGESWYFSSGGYVQRAFHENGQIKGVSWLGHEGSRIDVKINLSGLFEGRSDTFPNGDQIITKYNEFGQVSEKWLLRKNGQQVRVM